MTIHRGSHKRCSSINTGHIDICTGFKEALDNINREKVAQQYAELFEESKVQQAKYNEVISSKDSLATWSAKIDSIEQYKTHEGATSSRIAKTPNMTSWIKPSSKFAKLQDSGMLSL